MTTEHLDSHTPLMRQYHIIKQRHPDALLLFQVGDFYELFFDDAKRAAAVLGIVLTKRGKTNGEPIPLCGVPLHARDHYIPKLIRAGFKVAICEQLEEPVPGKVVERGVTQVLTPGTLTDAKLLDAKSASYIFSFFPHEQQWGLLFGELLTAQLFATVLQPLAHRSLESELIRFFPDEILLPVTQQGKEFEPYFKRAGYFTSFVQLDDAPEQLNGWLEQFKPEVRGQLEQHQALKSSLLHFYAYVRSTNQDALSQFSTINLYAPEDFLVMDAPTQRNLELVRNTSDGSRQHTLYEALDGALTPMGSRTIKKWIMRPLVQQGAIVQRQDLLDYWIHNVSSMHQLQEQLKSIGDVERSIGRIALRKAHIHDYHALAHTLAVLPHIAQLLQLQSGLPLLATLQGYLGDFSQLRQLLAAALNDDPTRDWIIKKGFDEQLDRMRDLVDNGTHKILELESQEQKLTGIGSLKIRYNQIYGYSIEITKANLPAVPERYIRRQSLVGKERFITPELQQLQQELITARAEIEQAEQQILDRIKQEVHNHVPPLRKAAHGLAYLDALVGLANVAYEHGYTRPILTADRDILITQGRHPVVERTLSTPFIANDTALDDQQSLWIITGPNMGGKSTYLRQVALMGVMAQIGSFVPAQAARLPLLDRIFTRIGAGDNLAEGKSTFLVEMEETASICSQATNKSLVILDEVGRGTSTFDGLAIAQAVVEYLYAQVGARCLFATHYHELTALQEKFPGIASYYAASRKTENGIIFLYKIIRGVADGSFGIEVAKLAQLPPAVIERARDIVHSLEAGPEGVDGSQLIALKKRIADLESRIAQQGAQLQLLQSVDYNELSPKGALDLLWKLKEREQ